MSIAWASDFFDDLKIELNETAPSETNLIRITNRVLKDLAVSLDMETAIRLDTIYYCGKDFEEYSEPSEMKTSALIQIRPKNVAKRGVIKLVSPMRFSQYHTGSMVCFAKDQALEHFKIKYDYWDGLDALITDCDNLTADGTWTAGTGATNITLDEYDYKKGTGAINFDTDGDASKTATISFVKSTAIDISDYTNQQRIRFFLKTPTAPSSIEVRWGNDASNYYKHTSISTRANGASFSSSDWNEVEASKASATMTGTVDDTAIDYFVVILTFSAATTDTDFLIDNIKAIKPEEMECEYYSKNLAATAAGVYSEALTVSASTTDLILIYNENKDMVIFGVCARYLKMHGDKQAKADSADYFQLYENEKLKYKKLFPSRRAVITRRKEMPSLY